MAQDELEEINGLKPNVQLLVGEEREVGSTTSKSTYKIKRASDHYYCSCPAWRNQSGAPINARTCKHLKTFLGSDYEEARVALNNPDGPVPKASKTRAKTTAMKTKPGSKRKRASYSEEDDAADGQESSEKQEQGAPLAKPAAKKTKVMSIKDTELDVRNEGKEESQSDELAIINGARPKVYLRDGEEREVGSATGKSKYKVKRTWDHYYCSCPAWRNQAGRPVNARTCKHLKSLLGDDYEEARLQLKGSGVTTGDGNKMGVEVPKVEAAKVGINDNGINRAGEEAKQAEQAEPAPDEDELMEINGVKPKVYMKDGDEQEVGSLTSNSKYKVKRTWDHYYCSCPAWRNQGGAPVNARTCKHLKLLLGEEYENARVMLKNPDGAKASKPAMKKARKGKTKSGDANGESGENEADNAPTGKTVPELLLATKWDLESGPDPTGWWISEKLDGVRTYYDGQQMISRLGNPFTPPQWFLDTLPKDVKLDGELFGGRGKFQSTVSVVKTVNSPHWKTITFQVFDVPSHGNEPFEARIAFLKELFGPGGTHHSEHVVVVDHEKARDRQHVLDKLREIERLGGEGLMLRKPESVYDGFRSSTLLKIKTFYDAEAVVTGYVGGKGKHAGATGALKCKMESGKTFNVGTGLSDKQRKNPPEVGSIIIYRFQELTKDGVPRFPSFVGIAADKDKPKDAEIRRTTATASENI